MRNSAAAAFFATASVSLLLGGMALTGCGGGAGSGGDGGGSSTPVITSRSFNEAAATNFQPNYRPSLDTLRRWPQTRIKIFVRAVGDDRDRTVPVRNAMALWQEATQNYFTFEFVGLESEADIVVNFVSGSTLSERAVGYTTVTFQTPSQTLTHADIYVGKEPADDVLTQIVSHELGHAMGIDGHSQSDLDLMFPRLNLPTRVSESDINTIYSGYSSAAASSTSGTTAGSTNSESRAVSTQTVRIDCVR